MSEQNQVTSEDKKNNISFNDKYLLAISKLKIHPFFKRKIVAFSLPIVLILILFLLFNPFSSTVSNIPIYKVKKDNFLVSITESGELRAKSSIAVIAPRIRGNLKIVYLIQEGTYVKADDEVVKFDPTEALNNLREAESRLEIALSDKEKMLASHKSTITRMESDLKSSELSYELSKLNLEQMKFEADIKQQEAKLQHQRNELSHNKAKQDLASQKIIHQSELNKVNIDVQQRQSDLERSKRDLEMLTLKAPAEGLVVYENNWQTGRKIAIGDQPWQGMTILTLPDLSRMESITHVNEVDVSRIKKDLPVIVRLDAFRDSSFNGVISSVASLGKNKDNNSTIKVFEILVDIKSNSEILKPGMTTSNRMIINQIENVLFVPQESIFEKDGKKIVYVKSGSSFNEVEVEVGEKSEDYIVITKGLEENMEVALRDPTITIDSPAQETQSNNSVDVPNSGNN